MNYLLAAHTKADLVKILIGMLKIKLTEQTHDAEYSLDTEMFGQDGILCSAVCNYSRVQYNKDIIWLTYCPRMTFAENEVH